MGRHARLSAALAIATVVLLVAPALAATTNVSATNFVFTPKTAKIHLGDSVTWKNNAAFTSHTSTSDSGLSWKVTPSSCSTAASSR